MLILECVEQKKKKKCRGSNGVGYCPFPALCRDRRSAMCMESASVRNIEALRARAGVHGKACRDSPPWVLCLDIEFPVSIEMTCPMSRHRI